MELSATAKVILGMLSVRPRSGYEIKQLVDKSTRFFWAASYGQIYPELKRLANAGLIEGSDASQGARQRTVHRLTAKGSQAVEGWLAGPPEVFELRDEGLLKLFFAGSADDGRAAEIARERAAHSAEIAERLHGIAEQRDRERGEGEGPAYEIDEPSTAVLRYGIELNEWIAEWFERAADDLERRT